MSTATITSKGQVTIPVSVRQRLGVQPGDRVEFIEMENGVFQLVAASRDIRSLKGQVPKPAKAVTIEEMNETIESRGRA
ncbi:MAG: AbrB/MazE/SpoVT family DNA-binding domain-containing protein [Bdellovibrionota bacterium]